MKSLKRHRTIIDSDAHTRKKACSNPFIFSRIHEQTSRCQNLINPSTRLSPSSSGFQSVSAVPKRCIHKIVTTCSLTQATCCACIDARPEGFSFVRYMDGHSWGQTDHRWQYYCHGCQMFWKNEDDLGRRHRRPLGWPKAQKDTPDVVKVNYGAGSIDIARSVDLTLDGLKAEVARLMQYDPSHLMLSDLAMHNGEVVVGSADDGTLIPRATHINFRCVTTWRAEDEAMEDVQYDQA